MNQILQLVISAGGAGVLAAVINAIINRRKLSAEATQIITQAAAGTVQNVMSDNAALREKVVALEGQVVKLQAVIELAEQRERIHTVEQERYQWHQEQWHQHCSRMADMLRDLGKDPGNPPPPWLPRTLEKKAVDPGDQEL